MSVQNPASMPYQQCLHTPIGELQINANDQDIEQIFFQPQESFIDRPNAITHLVKQQLEEYFLGQRTGFDLPLGAVGTDFQHSVWRQLCAIPFGTTASYGDIAKQLNKPTAMRAVGAANGRNPIPIIVPCHRVIGANGSLTGFAGGLAAKQWLLQHEGVKLP